MRSPIQSLLAALYSTVRRTGIFQTAAGRWAFERAYDLYKRHVEAGPVDRLQTFVRPGAWVLDVGANIGFFTLRLARWVSEGGRVLAIEPEPVNFSRLLKAVEGAGLGERTDLLQAAAADQPGTLMLALNPDNPADHRLSADGTVPVKVVRLDDLWEHRGCPPVSLVKIDVQGAEMLVLAGASRLLAACQPPLFLEVDTLRGWEPASALLNHLADLGYAPHRLPAEGAPQRLTVEQALAEARAQGYTDYLFLPASS